MGLIHRLKRLWVPQDTDERKPVSQEHIEAIADYIKGTALFWWANGVTDRSAPISSNISLTNICNHRCFMCGHSEAMRKSRGYMSEEVLDKVLACMPESVKFLKLFKQGESLLHKEFSARLKRIKETLPNVFPMLVTNCSRLDEEKARTILEKCWDVDIGIHAADPVTYKQITRTGNFDRAVANAKMILRMRKEMDSQCPIYLTFVRNSFNRHLDDEQIFRFLETNFPEADMYVLKWEQNACGVHPDHPLKAVFDDLDNQDLPVCIWPWASIIFLWDGRLGYCAPEPFENVIMGEVGQNPSFIHQSEAFQRLRELMHQRRYDELADLGFKCKECSWLLEDGNQNMAYLLPHGFTFENLWGDNHTGSPWYSVFRNFCSGNTHEGLKAFERFSAEDRLVKGRLIEEWHNYMKKLHSCRNVNKDRIERVMESHGVTIDGNMTNTVVRKTH